MVLFSFFLVRFFVRGLVRGSGFVIRQFREFRQSCEAGEHREDACEGGGGGDGEPVDVAEHG